MSWKENKWTRERLKTGNKHGTPTLQFVLLFRQVLKNFYTCRQQISSEPALFLGDLRRLHWFTLSAPIGCRFVLVLVPSSKFKGPANWQPGPITSVLFYGLHLWAKISTCSVESFPFQSQFALSELVWRTFLFSVATNCPFFRYSGSNQYGSHTCLL